MVYRAAFAFKMSQVLAESINSEMPNNHLRHKDKLYSAECKSASDKSQFAIQAFKKHDSKCVPPKL